MADMAPALTEAATQAHHRLKLAASSSTPASSPSVTQPDWKQPGARRAPQLPALLPLRRNGLNGAAQESRVPGRVIEAAQEGRVPGRESVQDSGPWTGKDMEEGGKSGSPALCPVRAARMTGRQQELGARARRLCRRLQVIQAKQVERHVRQQLSGLVELLSDRGAAGLSGSSQMELERLAGSSSARLRAAQGGFDSDATESSSGGESDTGEQDSLPAGETMLRSTPQCNRHTDWRWAVERAAIICRWTWLQAQVSDLEFRIRQQTEIYKQIRCTKGSVILGDSAQSDLPNRLSAPENVKGSRVPSSSCSHSAVKVPSLDGQCEGRPSNPHVLRNLDKQCSRLTHTIENVPCQNPSPPSVSECPGSQKPSRQVNGLINCVRSSVSCNGSAEDVDAEAALGKKQRMDGHSTPVLADPSCVSARTRPLCGHKRRRLVRASSVSSLSRKPQKPLSIKCGCWPPTTCILCGCKTYAKSAQPSATTVNERIALMEPGYHPILSFPYDLSLNLHFEALLKEDRLFRLKPLMKFSQVNKKPLDRVRRPYQSVAASDFAGTGYSHGRSDQEKLYQYNVESWQRNAKLSDRIRSPLRRTPPSTYQGSLFRDERQYKGVSNPNLQISSPVTSRPSALSYQLSSLTDTPTASSASQQASSSANLKRKRFENSYDIDNIVIPMSMAAAARVEKLQYKEILTPSWRVLDSVERDTVVENDPELEDLCDEAYLTRHSAYEELERSRWDSWATVAPQRRGSRSSNKSDGRWTPQPPCNSQGPFQPASPDVGFQSLNDIPLTLSSADSPDPYSTVQCFSVRSRTRVLSWSEDTRSSTPEIPDVEELVLQPWEPRSFPLSDRDQRALQNLPVTPSRGRNKPHPDVLWHPPSKPGTRTESLDFGMSTEHLAPSKEPPLPNSISVVRFRAQSGEKIASLEYFPARPVNKR
ncbi:KAT8 regulatory NSL complex subunit 1-like [Pelodytes ibericus]